MSGFEKFWDIFMGNDLAQAIFELNLFPYKCPKHSQTQSYFIPTCLWRWNRQGVPKRQHIKFRRRGNYPEESIQV